MNFKSQISTTVEQSKRLLALGLKAETADLHKWYADGVWNESLGGPGEFNCVPAWSLNRLIEMCPHYLGCYDFVLSHSFVEYTAFNDDGRYHKQPMSVNDNLYDMMIDCIERLIKDNNFRKEYLNI